MREGIREAGGIVLEFPVHPIQETGERPTAGLDRNLAYLGLVEVLYGYPFDGVVLTIGCDKTTPAALMAAATVNLPAIALSVGPMLNGWHKGERTGSGTIVWKARQLLATGEIDDEQFVKLVASSAPSTGYCNTMGTATTMNSLCPEMRPGSIVVCDNFPAHKVAGVRQCLEDAGIGALPPAPGLRRGRLYSPGFNPIEQVPSASLRTGSAKVKALLRRAAPRSFDANCDTLKAILGRFKPDECSNYLCTPDTCNHDRE